MREATQTVYSSGTAHFLDCHATIWPFDILTDIQALTFLKIWNKYKKTAVFETYKFYSETWSEFLYDIFYVLFFLGEM